MLGLCSEGRSLCAWAWFVPVLWFRCDVLYVLVLVLDGMALCVCGEVCGDVGTDLCWCCEVVEIWEGDEG